MNDLPSIFSLQTWTIRHHLRTDTLESVFERVRGQGYRNLEVSYRGGVGYRDFFHAMRDTGLSVSGLHLPSLWDVLDSEVHDALGPVCRQAASELSGKVILTFMGHPELTKRQIDTDRAYERYAARLRHAVRYLRATFPSAKFAYHLYDFDIRAGFEAIQHLVDAGLGFVVDTYFSGAEKLDLPSFFARFGDSVFACHLNDYKMPKNSQDGFAHVALGSGDAKLWTWLGLLGTCRLCDNLVVEHGVSETESGLDVAGESAQWLREQFSNTSFAANRNLVR